MAVSRHADWLKAQPELLAALPELSGKRLACHCRLDEACHGDNLIQQHKLHVSGGPGMPKPPTDAEAAEAASKRCWVSTDWETKEANKTADTPG